jgi:1-acyl-sn-glycerol-3-phosphate acyltransferase
MSNRSLETRHRAKPETVRDTLRSLQTAFDQGGIEALHATHLASLAGNFRYRALYRLLDLMVPMTPILAVAKDLDRLVGDVGASAASRRVLARPPIPWRTEMPERGQQDILSAPVVFYGKHGSALTPLLLAAALDRPDLKMVAASHIAKIGPNVERCSFPVHAAAQVKMKSAGRRGVTPRALGWIAWKSERGIDREAARERNRASLARAVEHVRSGGGLLIAPDPRERKRPWRQGIGVVVVSLAHDPGASPAYVVPWSITGASITGLFQLLSRNPLMRALGRMRFRRPIRVAFGEPVPVRHIVEQAGYNPAKVTEVLERDYRQRGL